MIKGLSSIRHSVGGVFSKIWAKCKHFFGWLGPRRTLLLFFIIISIQTGIGTIMGFSGKPADAPHLLIPETLRGILWIVFALIAFGCILKRNMRKDKIAILFLSFMPMLRLVSYLFSWIFSLDFLVDSLFNDTLGLQGSSAALYLSIVYQLEMIVLITAGWSPAKWKTVSNFLAQEIHDENKSAVPDKKESTAIEYSHNIEKE